MSTTQIRWIRGAVVWAAALTFVLFQFFLQLSSGEMVDGLMSSFHVAAFGASVLASTYYYIYVLLQTPGGFLVDRFGTRFLLSVGAVVCAVGTLMFGSAHSIWIAGLGRILMGTGAACAFVGSLNLIGYWFPARFFPIMAAMAETVGMLGTIVGGSLLAEVIYRFGWRDCMLGASALLLVIAALIALVVRDTPPGESRTCSSVYKKSFFKNLKIIVKNKYAWINGIYSGLMFSVVTVFVALWGIPFLMKEHHLGLLHATLIANMVFMGVALAGPVIGWLDNYISCRRCVLSAAALLSAICMALIIYLPNLSLAWLATLMVMLGVFASAYVLTLAVANEFVPPHLRGASLGFANTLSVGAAPVLQPLIGLILGLMVGHTIKHHGLANYTLYDYDVALIVLPLVLVIAAVLAWFIPRKKAPHEKHI